jgi:hypothetical protein
MMYRMMVCLLLLSITLQPLQPAVNPCSWLSRWPSIASKRSFECIRKVLQFLFKTLRKVLNIFLAHGCYHLLHPSFGHFSSSNSLGIKVLRQSITSIHSLLSRISTVPIAIVPPSVRANRRVPCHGQECRSNAGLNPRHESPSLN